MKKISVLVISFAVFMISFALPSYSGGKVVKVIKANSPDEVYNVIKQQLAECSFTGVKYSGGQWEIEADSPNCRGKIEIYPSDENGENVFPPDVPDYVRIKVEGFDNLGGAEKIADIIIENFQ